MQNKLVQGEYDVVIILEENILKMADKGEPVKVAYPSDGAAINPSPIAIFASSQNPEAAKALTDWWLSKEGQEMVVKGWMHSVRDDVASPKRRSRAEDTDAERAEDQLGTAGQRKREIQGRVPVAGTGKEITTV